MTIHAGDLQARLTVTGQVFVDRPDGGQDIEEVTVLANEPAQVVAVSASEQLRLGTLVATATYRAHLRMPKDVTVALQLLTPVTPAMSATVTHGYTGQVQEFEIVKAIDLDGMGRELELTLEARVT